VSRPEAFASVDDGGKRGCDDDTLDGRLHGHVSMRAEGASCISTYRALLDRLQDSSCSNDSRVNQILYFISGQPHLKASKCTHLLYVCNIEMERTSSVKYSLERRV
jgi:hypothetical protein